MLERHVQSLTDGHVRMWQDTGPGRPVLGAEFSWREQRNNGRRTDRMLDSLEHELERFPDSEIERDAWRTRIEREALRFGQTCLGLPGSYPGILSSDDYVNVTTEFVRCAREFDESLTGEALFQALRNVWIMASLQLLLDLEVAFTPSIFAYSMLYPYTDNYLDHPGVSGRSKSSLCRRLGSRLAGKTLVPRTARETAVFDLVGMIESQYPRRHFPRVYASLQAIHRAQVNSLSQQGRQHPAEADILAISVEKGGTSVLADGYLVAGDLDEQAAAFCFGYGVFLQLLDDLQDVRQDLEAEHVTLFSGSARVRRLDHLTSRLYRFMERVLESPRRFSAPRFDALKQLILRSCTLLLLQALAVNARFYSRGYLRRLQVYSPLRFAYIRKQRGTLEKRLRRLERLLQQRGVTPLESIAS